MDKTIGTPPMPYHPQVSRAVFWLLRPHDPVNLKLPRGRKLHQRPIREFNSTDRPAKSEIPTEYEYIQTVKINDLTKAHRDVTGKQVAWTLEEFLDAHDIIALRQSIDAFWKKVQDQFSVDAIRDLIEDVLQPAEFKSLSIPFGYTEVPSGADLYRARRINSRAEISTFGDVWAAPSHLVKEPGRLNVAEESLLYTAASIPLTAAVESRARPGELVAMTRFHVIKPFNVVHIGGVPPWVSLNVKRTRKLKEIMDFVESVFQQKYDASDEARYVATEIVAKEMYGLDPVQFPAWGYQSVLADNPLAYNVCLRPDVARSLLQHVWTDIIRVGPFAKSLEGQHRIWDRLVLDKVSGRLVPSRGTHA